MRAIAQRMTAAEAVAKIPSGATIAVGGFVGAAHPEALTAALEERFLNGAQPRDLTLIYAAGQGDRQDRGLNHLAHTGLLRRVIGGHWNLAPKLGKLALANEFEAYNFPQGVLCALLREIAARRPGIFTKIGLNTFIDPRNGGGRMNARTTEDLIENITLHGEDWLWYRSVPIHVGLIRATRADRVGNLSMEEEGLIGDVLPIAQAAKNHGGIVLAQVKEFVDCIDDPKSIRVPGILVDAVVQGDEAHHWQTFATPYDEGFVRRHGAKVELAAMTFSERKIIGRRALQDIPRGAIVNLGIGLPETIANVAAQQERLGEFTLTVESGPIGGVPASGLSFGCSTNPEAIIDQPSQFDFYDGGGIDFAALGAVQIDAEGSVCVSSMGSRFAGVGGFVNISQSAKAITFCCTFRAGDLAIDFTDGALRILKEGTHCKFVKKIEQVCFHGPTAFASGQKIRYVTERAVFELDRDGLVLTELAPGIDLEKEILALMEFRPRIADPLRLMPSACFSKS